MNKALANIDLEKREALYEKWAPLNKTATDYLFALRLALIPTFIALALLASLLLQKKQNDRRRKMEKALASSEARLRVTLSSIGDGVICTDLQGKITFLNAMAELLTGWKSVDAQGRPLDAVLRVFDAGSHEPLECPAEAALLKGEVIISAAYASLLSQDGTERSVSYSAAPIRSEGGGAPGYMDGVVLVLRDMTERVRLVEAGQKTQKMEALSALTAGIAHDFNNLLGGLYGYLELAELCLKEGDSSVAGAYLEKAREMYQRAREMSLQLLTFAKGGIPIFSKVELGPLIRRKTIEVLEGSKVSCHFFIADDLLPCFCDESQMEKVIENLVRNAMQAMTGGGIVYVSCENVSVCGDEFAEPRKSGTYARIQVRDHGVGMKKEVLNRVFEPFFTTKDSGHGLGLSTNYTIVQRHGGWIEAESAPGQGSTFTVYLPSVSNDSDSYESERNALAAEGQDDYFVRITKARGALVMDKEMYSLEIMEAFLRRLGFVPTLVRDGAEAIAAYSDALRGGNPFAVAILDISQEKSNGIDVGSEIKRLDPGAKLVATVGIADMESMGNPGASGFSDCLRKPFDFDEIEKTLKKCLGVNGTAQ
jgi:PAS domain S-box-containing protein